ncbi:nonselective cation channel [Rhodotorula toruloides]|uniref:Nonselective cation channel n=1 Tax=Rhodotorula toruloides TaxID=5286 RepID=A0A511KA44_RHOTO|nr:nonselective cation channel [Rhodotorula toruloides]
MATERTALVSPDSTIRGASGLRPSEHCNGLMGPGADRMEQLAACDVFGNAHWLMKRIRRDVDVAVSESQFFTPEFHFTTMRPLEADLADRCDPSIVYVLLLCRLQFIRERDSALASSSINETRARLCEIMAVKLLRHQAALAKGPNQGLLAMARALVGGFHAFQGASEEVIERIREREGYSSRVAAQGASKTNALELAILGKARHFIKSQTCQRVINAIYDGRITYTSSSFIDFLGDRYKTREVSLYEVHKAPMLDHYRLRVPKYRAVIEFCTFLVLFVSFLLVIVDRHSRYDGTPVSKLSWMELWFFFYSIGYTLDKITSIAEHGWSVYAAGLTNGLDAVSLPIYCAALAFTAISNNLLILSLRAMLLDFFFLMSITVFCFIGFVFALNHLSEGAYSVTRISEWLIFIFFGLDGSGIDESPKFDHVLGPILFVSFAALSNTLLTSVLVAILSTTYANIANDAAAEDMFRKAVGCFEGVKGNSLFDYVPPLNLIALCVMWPLSHVLSPRWFHKVNVFATQMLSLPILLIIALYERQSAGGSYFLDWWGDVKVAIIARLPRKWSEKLSLLEGAHWECEAIFEYTPSGDEKSSSEEGFDEEESFGGPDDVEEAVLEAGQADKRISSRASTALDPAKVYALQQEMMAEAQREGQTGQPRPPALTPTPSAAVPLSRQASFAGVSETSTIRAKPSRVSSARYSALLPSSPEEPSTSSGAQAKPFPSIPPQTVDHSPTGDLSTSPPASPRTHFAALPSRPQPVVAPTGRELRRFHTVDDRLPANATGTRHRRRRSSIASDYGAISRIDLSSSAPTKESPLARLYSLRQADDVFSSGGPRAGGIGRRLSMGLQANGTRAEGASARTNAWLAATAASVDKADEPTPGDMMALIQGLVSTVSRLEQKLDDERGKRREASPGDEADIEEED